MMMTRGMERKMRGLWGRRRMRGGIYRGGLVGTSRKGRWGRIGVWWTYDGFCNSACLAIIAEGQDESLSLRRGKTDISTEEGQAGGRKAAMDDPILLFLPPNFGVLRRGGFLRWSFQPILGDRSHRICIYIEYTPCPACYATFAR